MRMYFFLLAVVLLNVQTAFSQSEIRRLTTPRGDALEVTVHTSSDNKKNPAIIIAPGQSCNSKGPIFETLGKMGPLENVTVIRFEWAYCLKDPSKPVPSENLKNEIEDFYSVMDYASTLPSVDAEKIVLAGKSLGSVVAYAVFKDTPSAKGVALLTPICSYVTDEQGNPLPAPQSVCEENYPGMKQDLRPVYMTMGELDSACVLSVLFDYLKDSKGNILVNVAGGDHGFRMKNAEGKVDDAKTQRNIDSVINAVLNWMGTGLR